jgi:hypothetical protein
MGPVGSSGRKNDFGKYPSGGIQGKTSPGAYNQFSMDTTASISEKRFNKKSQRGLGKKPGRRNQIQDRAVVKEAEGERMKVGGTEKNEHRTSNVQHRMSNEKKDDEASVSS